MAEDIYDLLVGDDDAARRQSALMAARLRGQQDLANLALLTGDPVLGRLGQAVGQRAASEQGLLAGGLGDRANRNFQAGQQTDRLRSSERLGRAPPFVIVTGEGGQQFFVDPRNPARTAQPVMGPDGHPINKPMTQKAIPQGERVALIEGAEQAQAIGRLRGGFKPEFAGGGPAGSVATKLYQWMGSLGSKAAQADASWWADFGMLVDLPQRNAVFGASLSEGEKAAWEGAKNIKPGSSPELVQQKLAEMQAIVQRKMGSRAEALQAEGYNPEAIRALTGADKAAPDAPAPSATEELRARIARMKRDGLSPGQIKEALQREMAK